AAGGWVATAAAPPVGGSGAPAAPGRGGRPGAPTARPPAPAELAAMISRNVFLALGPDAAAAARRAAPPGRWTPVAIDGRLHAWEWLLAPSGRVLKTDGVDHHAAHDLVGRQDVLWDVAGAVVELGLEDERARLLAAPDRA